MRKNARPASRLTSSPLEQALHGRRPAKGSGLFHHPSPKDRQCHRGPQYVAIRYTERLTDADVEPSVGGVGDSYGNVLAETVDGLYKTEAIRHRGPWRTLNAVEFATLEWGDWLNQRRLPEPNGNIPPPRPKRATMLKPGLSPWRRDSTKSASGKPGAVQTLGGQPSLPTSRSLLPHQNQCGCTAQGLQRQGGVAT